ncbi:MAG: signal peptide peptidase SppA [Gemmatimonadetes bacterium]|nr:signal peptide peptidase SppA [Gemmatimonadota bacterium]
MARKSDWIIGGMLGGGVLVIAIVMVLLIAGPMLTSERSFSGMGDGRVALVEVRGPITRADDTVSQIIKYREDDSVRAIVLRVESPGGAVAPTQEIFDELRKTREAGKVIVASMGSVAASGGYYIACAADSIMANPGTLTGSIGVIMVVPQAEGLLDKVGIDWQVVKSGRHKDIGSVARGMTDTEVGLLQSVVDDVYDQFVEAVTQFRPLTREEVVELADGRIYTGNQALPLRLVDRLGTYQDAIAMAGRMAGLPGKPNVVRQRPKSFFELLMDNMDSVTSLYSPGVVEYRYR